MPQPCLHSFTVKHGRACRWLFSLLYVVSARWNQECDGYLLNKGIMVGDWNHITFRYTISRHSWLQKHLFAQTLLGCGVKCFGAPTREWTLLDFAQSCRLHKVTSRWSLTLHATNDSPLSPPVPSLPLFVSLSLSLHNICHELERASHQLCLSLTVELACQPVRLRFQPH